MNQGRLTTRSGLKIAAAVIIALGLGLGLRGLRPEPSAAPASPAPNTLGIGWILSATQTSPVSDAPALPNGVLVETSVASASQEYRLVALDPATGALKWVYAPSRAFRTSNISLVDGSLAFGLSDRRVVFLDPATGKVKREIRIPETTVGFTKPCGEWLCLVTGDFRSMDLPASRGYFMRPMPRMIFDPGFIVWDLKKNEQARKFLFEKLESLPNDLILSKGLVALSMPTGMIEVYDFNGKQFTPKASFPRVRPEALSSGQALYWINAGQLHSLTAPDLLSLKTMGLPARSKRLLAVKPPMVLFGRGKEGGGEEIWSYDLNTGKTARFVAGTIPSQDEVVIASDHLYWSEGNHVFDLSMKDGAMGGRVMPALLGLGVKPVISTPDGVLAAIETPSQGVLLVNLVAEGSLNEGSEKAAFGPSQDPVMGLNVILNPGRKGQWAAMQGALRIQISEQGVTTAQCGCLDPLGSAQKVYGLLVDTLKTRDRNLVPLVLGELESANLKDFANDLLYLYFAIEIKLGRPQTDVSTVSQGYAASWPAGWSQSYLRFFGKWILDRLLAAGTNQVAPIYRHRLRSEGYAYDEQVEAVHFLSTHYSDEREVLDSWVNRTYVWDKTLPSLNRTIPRPDLSNFVAYSRTSDVEIGLFFMDFPVKNSLWFYVQKPQAVEGRIYFTKWMMPQALRMRLEKAIGEYLKLPSGDPARAKPPIAIEIRKEIVSITFPSEGLQPFNVNLDEIREDQDQDGWTDVDEDIIGGLDKRKADTDSDGVPDGQDANPAVAGRTDLNHPQAVIQALFYHDCRMGLTPTARDWLGTGATLSTRWIDYSGIDPVELPACGSVYMEVPRSLMIMDACSFADPETGSAKAAPKDSVAKGVVRFSPDGDRAWVSKICGNRWEYDRRAYALRKLNYRWVVVDATDEKTIESAPEE